MLIVWRLANDDDGDGVSVADENNAHPGGDGNGDGILDSQQPSVASLRNPLTNSGTTLQTSGCTNITSYAVVSESILAIQDDRYDYPVGLNDFTVACPTAGGSAVIKIFYDKVYDTSAWKFRKFDTTGKVYSDITSLASFTTETVGAKQVTAVSYTVTDGSATTDTDGLLNGVIHDPAGPAVLVQDTVSPTPAPLAATGTPVHVAAFAGIVSTLLGAAVIFKRFARRR